MVGCDNLVLLIIKKKEENSSHIFSVLFSLKHLLNMGIGETKIYWSNRSNRIEKFLVALFLAAAHNSMRLLRINGREFFLSILARQIYDDETYVAHHSQLNETKKKLFSREQKNVVANPSVLESFRKL